MIPPSQQTAEVRSSPSRDAIARHHQDAIRKIAQKLRPAWGGVLIQGLREVLLPSLRENMGTTAKVPWEFVPQIFPQMPAYFYIAG